MFDNKKILITGGTGSLGQALTKKLLSLNVDTIRIFSRNEHKQIDMESKFNDKRLRFLLGDIRDLDRLTRAVEDIDIVKSKCQKDDIDVVTMKQSERDRFKKATEHLYDKFDDMFSIGLLDSIKAA